MSMPAPRREVGIHLEERRLDEELIGVTRQGDGFFDIALMIGDIDDVSDFLATRRAKRALFENTERHKQIVAN